MQEMKFANGERAVLINKELYTLNEVVDSMALYIYEKTLEYNKLEKPEEKELAKTEILFLSETLNALSNALRAIK